MAHYLLCCLVSLHLIASMALARPIRVDGARVMSTLVLHGPAAQAEAEPPSSHPGGGREGGDAGAPEISGMSRPPPSDKSIAAAEVIVGGLAAAVLVAVVAYIRVTRRRSVDDKL